MKKTTKTIAIFSVAISLLSVISFAYGTKYIEGLISKTTEFKEEVEKLQVRVGHLKALHQAAQDTNDDKVKINSYIVQSGGSVQFITELERLAGNIGLDFNTDRIESKTNPELDVQNKELLSVGFTATGSWNTVFKFIKLVELLPYSITVQKIDLFALVGDKKTIVTTVATTSTSTSAKLLVKENNWKVVILFDVVKNKEK